MVFEYDLEYHQLPLKKMDITHETFWSSDNLPDIKLQSVDWCVKDFDWFINSWWRSFEKKVIPLQEYIDKEYQEEDEMTEDYAEDIISYWSDVNQLPWIVENKIERVKLLRWNGSIEVSDDEDGRSSLKNALLQSIFDWWDFDMNLNINLSVLEEQTDALESIVDDITNKAFLCPNARLIPNVGGDF